MTTKEIIQQIAEENGVTPREVEKDMREAIRLAMESSDPIAKELWSELSPNGLEPTVEMFLKYCCSML